MDSDYLGIPAFRWCRICLLPEGQCVDPEPQWRYRQPVREITVHFSCEAVTVDGPPPPPALIRRGDL